MSNTIDTEKTSASASPGQVTAGSKLKAAREAAGLSLDAVAQQLKLAPRQADSLYGRGLAELQKGQASEGRADLEAARRLSPRLDETFASYGVKPPAAYASSNSATM